MDKKIKISIAIPVYDMPNKQFFLERCLGSIREQTFQDYEIVITEKGGISENTNAAIKESKGELIKILYMDDYFSDKDALKRIVDNFNGHWMINACDNNPYPIWTDDTYTGNNKLGGPSALTIKNDNPLLFDNDLKWVLDCDYYQRMYEKYGEPTILEEVCVNIGVGEHQATLQLSDDIKIKEYELMRQRYAKS